jgi:membrane-associated phospholipid phosphatase
VYNFTYFAKVTNTKKIKFKIYVLALCCLITSATAAQKVDIDLLRHINYKRNTSLDPTFKTLTNSVFPTAVAVPVFLTAFHLIKKDSATKQRVIIIGGTLLVSSAVTGLLKYSIQRKRPFVTYPDINHITPEDSYSFPSGHTSTAFALATSVTIAYPKWYVAAPAYLWASSAAYSRMHFGVHYPSDVIAGALIGRGSAWLCYQLNKRLQQRK